MFYHGLTTLFAGKTAISFHISTKREDCTNLSLFYLPFPLFSFGHLPLRAGDLPGNTESLYCPSAVGLAPGSALAPVPLLRAETRPSASLMPLPRHTRLCCSLRRHSLLPDSTAINIQAVHTLIIIYR